MKKDIQNGVIIILAFIGLLMFAINWELQNENDRMIYDIVELRNDLNQANDKLDKATWNAEMLNWQLENLQPSDDR